MVQILNIVGGNFVAIVAGIQVAEVAEADVNLMARHTDRFFRRIQETTVTSGSVSPVAADGIHATGGREMALHAIARVWQVRPSYANDRAMAVRTNRTVYPESIIVCIAVPGIASEGAVEPVRRVEGGATAMAALPVK